MADLLAFPSFAGFNPFSVSSTPLLLPTVSLISAGGALAHAGRIQTSDLNYDLPAFNEHLLFIQLDHKMHLAVRVAGHLEKVDSARGDCTLVPRAAKRTGKSLAWWTG